MIFLCLQDEIEPFDVAFSGERSNAQVILCF